MTYNGCKCLFPSVFSRDFPARAAYQVAALPRVSAKEMIYSEKSFFMSYNCAHTAAPDERVKGIDCNSNFQSSSHCAASPNNTFCRRQL